MLITNHVLSGALVGAVAPGPASAFVVGVGSHIALDVVPHWGDPDHGVFMKVAVVDGLVGLAAMAAVAAACPPAARRRVVAGMLGACFPDADKPCTEFVGRSPFPAAVDEAHRRIQHESPRRMPQEVLVAIAGAATLALLRARISARTGGA